MAGKKFTIPEVIEYRHVGEGHAATVAGLAGKLPPALLLLIIIGSFLPVLQNGFVSWDERTLVNNPNYRGLALGELRWMFGNIHFGQYQPLAWIMLGLDYLLWWMDPFGYHLTSLLLHAACAIVFYFVTLRLLSLGQLSGTVPRQLSLKATAGFAALVFAVHPLRVESVAWASARGDILSSLFLLWSVLCYLRAAALSEINRTWLWWMAASVAVYILSLLSSVTGAILPFIVLVINVYPLRRLDGPATWFRFEFRHMWLQIAPYFLLAIAGVGIALVAGHQSGEVEITQHHAFVTRVAHAVAAPAFYLWKTAVPLGLSPLYELRGWFLALHGLAALASSVFLFLMRKQWPALWVTWMCYLALLLIALVNKNDNSQLLADRHSYIPALPWALLIGVIVVLRIHLYMNDRTPRWLVFFGTGVTVLVVTGLGVLTWAQTRVWRDSEILWNHAAAVGKSSEAHNNLAALLETRGRYEEAIASYRQAVEIDPQRWNAHQKAARLLYTDGRYREAVEHYRSAVQINPGATEARSDLAWLLVTQGEITEAVQHFRKVLELAPGNNEARLKLGLSLIYQGRLGEAIAHLQQVADAEPGNARARVKLGQVLGAQGNLDKAIDYFRQAVRLQPEDAETHESLGRALAKQGKKDEAFRHLSEALRILKSSPASR